MTFKKYLRSRKAQSALEYIMVFAVLAVAVILVFKSFSPEQTRMKNIFGQAVTKAVNEINKDE